MCYLSIYLFTPLNFIVIPADFVFIFAIFIKIHAILEVFNVVCIFNQVFLVIKVNVQDMVEIFFEINIRRISNLFFYEIY